MIRARLRQQYERRCAAMFMVKRRARGARDKRRAAAARGAMRMLCQQECDLPLMPTPAPLDAAVVSMFVRYIDFRPPPTDMQAALPFAAIAPPAAHCHAMPAAFAAIYAILR